jgi:hypothetical protein
VIKHNKKIKVPIRPPMLMLTGDDPTWAQPPSDRRQIRQVFKAHGTSDLIQHASSKPSITNKTWSISHNSKEAPASPPV